MAYSTSIPPALLVQRIGETGSLWYYASADVHTDVDASGYFTDGYQRGMRVGDVVFVIETDNSYALSLHVVTVANATTGAVTVSGRVTS